MLPRVLPRGLEPVLAHFQSPREAGWLVANNGRVQKRIAFEGGSAVFSVSNDPKDLMGQALLRAGLISEGDLAQALAMPRAAEDSTPHLYAALIAMKKVTPEQTKVVFEQKLRESVLDLFLWPAGKLEIIAATPAPAPLFPTQIPVPTLLVEGAKRRARWKVVQGQFPSFDVAFERMGEWTAGFPATPGDKKLAKMLEQGMTLAAILLEMHGQDYPIAVRITNLFQTGVIGLRSSPAGFGVEIDVDVPIGRPEDVLPTRQGVSTIPSGEFTKVGSPPASSPAEDLAPQPFSSDLSSALLERAKALLAEKKYDETSSVLEELIQNDPMAAGDAWELMNVVEEAIIAQAEADGLTADAVLTLARPAASFAGAVFPPDQAFVLSRFASGKMNVGDLRALCPFPPVELFKILRKFLDEKMIRRV